MKAMNLNEAQLRVQQEYQFPQLHGQQFPKAHAQTPFGFSVWHSVTIQNYQFLFLPHTNQVNNNTRNCTN